MASFAPPARCPSAPDFDNLDSLTRTLRSQLLDVVKAQSSRQAELIEEALHLSKRTSAADADDPNAQQLLLELSRYIEGLAPEDVVVLADAFGMMLTLENIAEDVHIKRVADELGDPDVLVKRTVECLGSLMKGGERSGPVAPEAVTAALQQMDVDFVFTAHPTQVMRQGRLAKCQEIRAIMRRLSGPGLSHLERMDLMEKLRLQVHLCWRTDSLRRKPPSPQEEQRSLLSYVPESIFPAVPVLLRRLDAALARAGLPTLPLAASPFRFSSWMGGDRDGNPNVTATVTREVVLTTRITAATMYFEAVQQLMSSLTLSGVTSEFNALVEASSKRLERRFGDREAISRMRRGRGYGQFFAPNPANEPYRRMLAEVRDRLWETKESLQKWLNQGHQMPAELARAPATGSLGGADYLGPYTSKEELLEPLLAIHASLVASGDAFVADGPLSDLIRQVACFGLAMTALDIRQESTRHSDAMQAITQYLGLGPYSEWAEEQKVQFLEGELASRRPLIPQEIMAEARRPYGGAQRQPILSAEAHEVLATFAVIAELPLDSLGSYVISMAQSASDVLCVRLLQREFGVREPMLRVAPLFETLDDLQNAPVSLRTLFKSQPYREQHVVGGVQEVMIGYSDSGKDAGRLAAAWAQYEAQEKLLEVAAEFGVELVFFHGRGGTVGRGGGPVQVALRSQPAGSIQKGRMRVTVQGETIERQFGEVDSACRTLDTYISSMLEAELCRPAAVKPEWRAAMKKFQMVSCEAYRDVVFQDPRFVAYFRDVTPSAELGRANIGSRPAKRKAVDSVSSIRAIPWIFAWTQTRFNLPVWLGVGEALASAASHPAERAVLQDMYENFMFFRSVIDLLAMVFEKSDPNIAKLYDAVLATSEELKAMGAELGANFLATRATVLSLAGLEAPSAEGGGSWLKQKCDARNVYITPLNIMQVRCLQQSRKATAAGAPQEQLGDALLLTVKGIAAGLQNTG